MALYTELTEILDKIPQDNNGEWVIKGENDEGQECPMQMSFASYSEMERYFEEAIYRFAKMHPEYGLIRYSSILENSGIQWEYESMKSVDVSEMDGQTVMALLVGAVRAERFSGGVLYSFFKSGCIKRWIERLQEIDKA